jgi:class 3 adenylate cyclase/Tfp pilus assembly protein PilF
MAYNLIAWVYGQQGNNPEKTKNYFAALKIDEEIGDRFGAAVDMSDIANAYLELGNDSLALKYLDSAAVMLKEQNEILNLTDVYLNIGSIHQKHADFSKALKYFELALKTVTGTGDMRETANVYSTIASLFVDQGDDAGALKNNLLAVESLKSLEDYKTVAELYIDIGGCYTRLKQYNDARKYFDNALVLLKKINSESVSKDYYAGVELLDSATNNWKDAYIHYKISVRLANKLHNDENTKKIMQTSMQYEFDKKEAAAKAEQEKKDIQQRTIRNSIVGVLAGSLIFLVVVYRQRNKISKARKRSDELLLNILPSEVAEELKEKGSADAKQFDEVTVMFTDFKGFTQISEKLTPSELVSEIDTCFKAFDNIITKHNIEKIKTIGDSYMCAGGLPVTNKTHADDVVKAALEIQQFMQQHLQQRKKENKEVFEIRIGIHTGPVVAGIVGVKKFAYDIWGDTVNIASRMESSGEAGKVNISGNTFNLVKDKFSCIHRGKIQAKNKGEIDMYFVETVS